MENIPHNKLMAYQFLKKVGIQDILDLKGITEVAVNQPNRIWFDRGNGWEFIDEPRADYASLEQLATVLSVMSNDGIPLDFNNPISSVILPDGERGQIVIPPMVEDGCISMTFRKPSKSRFTLSDYENTGRLSGFKYAGRASHDLTEDQQILYKLYKEEKIKDFFTLAVEKHLNILLVGGTGSGKTTIMKALVDLYPPTRRIFTIEDVHELDLPNHPNHLHLFYKNKVRSPKYVIESCMRMKPDHIFLAELRGDEAWNYIEALNTGHSGSVTTTHANDCYSAFSRITGLVKQSEDGRTLDYDHIFKIVRSSIDIVCFFKGSFLKEIFFDPIEKNEILAIG